MRIRYYVLISLIAWLIASCGIFKAKNPNNPKDHTSSKPIKRPILEKYTQLLGTEVYNEDLYTTLDNWMGVPYKYGGKTRIGIDCSNFCCEILRSSFGFSSSYYFPSSKLAEQGKQISIEDAQEGDLVFFSINQNSKISHVGVYLKNNRFIHASTSKGVTVNSLQEEYYKKRFISVRRMK